MCNRLLSGDTSASFATYSLKKGFQNIYFFLQTQRYDEHKLILTLGCTLVCVLTPTAYRGGRRCYWTNHNARFPFHFYNIVLLPLMNEVMILTLSQLWYPGTGTDKKAYSDSHLADFIVSSNRQKTHYLVRFALIIYSTKIWLFSFWKKFFLYECLFQNTTMVSVV